MDLGNYLQFGTEIDDIEYENPPKIDITLEEAIEEYVSILKDILKSMAKKDPLYTLSGGHDSSLIYKFVDNPICYCGYISGNTDYDFASRLCPKTIKHDISEIDLEEALINLQSEWNYPHSCFWCDFFDEYVYTRYDNFIVVGEDLTHYNLLWNFKNRGGLINLFNERISIFSHEEVNMFGYSIKNISLKKNTLDDLMNFTFDWWSPKNRKIYYKYQEKGKIASPFLDERFLKFYKSLPIEYIYNKNITKEIVKRYLPNFISERKKRPYGNVPNPLYMENKRDSFNHLRDKYLVDRGKKIFKYLDYNLVNSYLEDFPKMWRLLNLSIWIQNN